MIRYIPLMSMLLSCFSSYAQQNDTLARLLETPLEELLDLPIYSVSKTPESAFEAPRTSAVVTKAQIRKAGCKNIPEALRLVPGVIVREQTNGNYDIHLRGLGNIPPNSTLVFFANSTTLVMIDNRPVYNYLNGGTFWETLPVGLNDVEQIEVVFGPADASYGPNAVSGVINIITRKPMEEGWYAVANVQYGNYHSLISGVAIGYKFNKKISIVASGNYTRLGRTQTDYYDFFQDKYVPIDSVNAVKFNPLNNTAESYPHPRLAYEPLGYNVFINYTPSEKTTIAISLGGQNSFAQTEFGSGLAYITSSSSNSRYASVRGSVHDFTFLVSHMYGMQNPVLGQPGWKWDLNTTDVNVEYTFHKIKNLAIIPGASFRTANYDDSKYANPLLNNGLWNGVASNRNLAGSLRVDYKLFENKLRLTAGTRIDHFSSPDKAYPSLQISGIYKLNNNSSVRALFGFAKRTPLLLDLFSNVTVVAPFPITSPTQVYQLEILGNKNIKLLTSNTYEVGFRHKLRDRLNLDITAYYITTRDFSDVVFLTGEVDSTGPISLTGKFNIDNLTIHTQQLGATLAISYDFKKLQIRPFITLQKTWLLDYSPYRNLSTAPPLASNNFDPISNNVNSNKGTKTHHLATPAVYGGIYINWAIHKKWNFNTNGYFFSNHIQLESKNLTYEKISDPRGQQQIPNKLILNATVSYKLLPKLTVFINFRNILNDRSVEFFKGDAPAFMIFGGLNFDLAKGKAKTK